MSLMQYSTFLYIIGGQQDITYGPTPDIYRCSINPDGSLGTWIILSSKLVISREYLSSILINTTLYIQGGLAYGANAGQTIEKAVVYPNGELSAFSIENYTVAAHGGGGLFYAGGYLNLIDGFAGGPGNYQSERAIVNADGSLGYWEPRDDNGLAFLGGFLQTPQGAYVIDGKGDGVVLFAPVLVSAPIFPNIPTLKLYQYQSLIPAFNLEDYNTGDLGTTYSIISNFLNLSNLSGSTVYQLGYTTSSSGNNLFRSANSFGEGTATNKVKYSTYKIHRLPQIILRPNQSWDINIGNYTFDSSNNLVIPPSFNQSDSLMVSDSTQLSAVLSNPSTITITTLSGFTSAQDIDIVASPQATAPYGVDIDKERIEIYPALSTTAFEFTNSNDTGVFSYQVPSGVSSLATIGYTTTVNDIHGGALQITFTSPSSGIKITPKFNTWLPNIPQSWYTLRVRVLGTNTTNGYLQLLYNGNPGKSPTDIQGYFRYSVPTTWTYIDIPINSFDSVSSASVMYPQLVLKANGGLGTIYIDEMEIFQATPPLLTSRYKTSDNYIGGYWNDVSATTLWEIEVIGKTPTINVTNGNLMIYTEGDVATQNGLKFTASTSKNTIYTISVNTGYQTGMHIQTQILSGYINSTQTQVQLTLLGAKESGSFIIDGDIASAVEMGRISPRTLRLAFFPTMSNYQIQFIVKNPGSTDIQINNTLADIQSDESNYGDPTLFP